MTPKQVATALTQMDYPIMLEALRLFAEIMAEYNQIKEGRERLGALNDPHVVRLFRLKSPEQEATQRVLEDIKERNTAQIEAVTGVRITPEEIKAMSEKVLVRQVVGADFASGGIMQKDGRGMYDYQVKSVELALERPLVEFTFDRKLSKLAQHEAAKEEIRVAKAEREELKGGIMAITRDVCGG